MNQKDFRQNSWNEMRYLYPAHMINKQHKEGATFKVVNHVRAADCEWCEQMCKNEQEYNSI